VHRQRDDDTLLVFMASVDTEARAGVGIVRDMVKIMNDMNVKTHAILITNTGLTCSASAAIASLMNESKYITHMTRAFLMFDILNHRNVPPHRLLTPPEIENLLTSRNLKLSQFPSIKIDDPVCRYFGGKPGDVFEIVRNRPTVGHHFYYRTVVPEGHE